MKASTSTIRSILSSGQYTCAELYDLTLSTGQVFHFTSFDVPVTASVISKAGTTSPVAYTTGFVIIRDKVSTKLGTEAGEMEMIIAPQSDAPGGAPLIAGYSIIQAARLGFLDGAQLRLAKLFTNPSVGANSTAVAWYLGTIQEIEIDRFHLHFTVNDAMAYLGTQQMPRVLYSVGCWHQVYDAGCALLKSAFTVTGTITSVTDASRFAASALTKPGGGAAAASYFDMGVLQFTSGANSGVLGTVNHQASAGAFTMRYPFPKAPAIGDTFTVYPGCDLQQGTCTAKFNNGARFAGSPFIPVPETILDGGTDNPPVQTPGRQAGQTIGSPTSSRTFPPGTYKPGTQFP